MPIYAYRCTSCGHAKDVLQKMSDPVLTVCPACGASTFAKQVTAAGFQLKGSGWYVTDFRGGASAAAAASTTGTASSETAPSTAGSTPDSSSNSSGGSSEASSGGGGCGTSCACH